MSRSVEKPEIIIFDLIEIRTPRRWIPWSRERRAHLYINGRRFAYESGAWAYWIPELRCKFLHSRQGHLDCRYPGVPSREDCNSATDPYGAVANHSPYTWQDWRNVYTKTAVRRAAELYVATERLYKAGLGPRPLGICMARRLIESGKEDSHSALGISTEDVLDLPTKAPCTEEEFLRAGVQPDHIRSCIRQQLRGYTIDLNSAIGAMPIDAEREISAIEALLEKQAHHSPSDVVPICT